TAAQLPTHRCRRAKAGGRGCKSSRQHPYHRGWRLVFPRELLHRRRWQPRLSWLRGQLAARPHHFAQRHRAAARQGVPIVDDPAPTAQSSLAAAGRFARRGAAVRLPGLAGPEKIMNSKTTGIWFLIAAALFALIFIFEHFLRPSAAEPSRILPELRPPAVTCVQVIPAGTLEIRADRTNATWLLSKPIVYPAQSAAIDAL